jgi:hypothetical protein
VFAEDFISENNNFIQLIKIIQNDHIVVKKFSSGLISKQEGELLIDKMNEDVEYIVSRLTENKFDTSTKKFFLICNDSTNIGNISDFDEYLEFNDYFENVKRFFNKKSFLNLRINPDFFVRKGKIESKEFNLAENEANNYSDIESKENQDKKTETESNNNCNNQNFHENDFSYNSAKKDDNVNIEEDVSDEDEVNESVDYFCFLLLRLEFFSLIVEKLTRKYFFNNNMIKLLYNFEKGFSTDDIKNFCFKLNESSSYHFFTFKFISFFFSLKIQMIFSFLSIIKFFHFFQLKSSYLFPPSLDLYSLIKLAYSSHNNILSDYNSLYDTHVLNNFSKSVDSHLEFIDSTTVLPPTHLYPSFITSCYSVLNSAPDSLKTSQISVPNTDSTSLLSLFSYSSSFQPLRICLFEQMAHENRFENKVLNVIFCSV